LAIFHGLINNLMQNTPAGFQFGHEINVFMPPHLLARWHARHEFQSRVEDAGVAQAGEERVGDYCG
jgi:hypothetical protein